MTTAVYPFQSTTPVDRLKVDEALAERNRIEGRLEELQEARRKYGEREVEINNELKKLDKAQAAEAQAAAFGGELDVTAAGGIRKLNAEWEKLGEVHQASKLVERGLRGELHRLHLDQIDAFAEHADTLGAKAVELTSKFRRDYEKAYAAWERTLTEWARIVEEYNGGRVRQGGQVAAELTIAPPPLTPPAQVFGAQSPRPAEIPGSGVPQDNPLTRKVNK